MVKISAVIITFNEEKNIERCLLSLKDVVDEIVVVDSFSKDRTEEICKNYEVNFIQHPFEGHIQQKNYAATQAKYDIVLSLDADEALSDELKSSILEIKDYFSADGYYFNRLSSYCGKWIKHSGWYPDRKLRLWNRTKGQWGGQNPHDKFIMQNEATLKFLKGDLLHYTYYTISEHVLQSDKFSEIGAKNDFERGRKMTIPKIIFFPLWRFVRNYFFKGGFLDGYYGFIICANAAHEVFLKYAKTRELQKNTKRTQVHD